MVLASVICWRIWFIRNQLVHESSELLGEDIVAWVANYITSYRAAQFPQPSKLLPLRRSEVPPSAPRVKINFDVGFPDSDHYIVAVVARKLVDCMADLWLQLERHVPRWKLLLWLAKEDGWRWSLKEIAYKLSQQSGIAQLIHFYHLVLS